MADIHKEVSQLRNEVKNLNRVLCILIRSIGKPAK